MSRTVALGLTTFALIAAVAACSSPAGTDAGPTAAGAKPAAQKAAKKGTSPKIDACTLLKDDEIEAVIGPNGGGHVGAGVGESICEWDNDDNGYSVTLSVGNKDTARNGLPADDVAGGTPGPDGISFASDDTASYVDQGRACYIQVSTLKRTRDRTAAVRFIKLVKARTAGKF